MEMAGSVAGCASISSLTMVPVACPLAIVAPVGDDSDRENVSLVSTRVSPRMSTLTVLAVSPAAKVSVPTTDA